MGTGVICGVSLLGFVLSVGAHVGVWWLYVKAVEKGQTVIMWLYAIAGSVAFMLFVAITAGSLVYVYIPPGMCCAMLIPIVIVGELVLLPFYAWAVKNESKLILHAYGLIGTLSIFTIVGAIILSALWFAIM